MRSPANKFINTKIVKVVCTNLEILMSQEVAVQLNFTKYQIRGPTIGAWLGQLHCDSPRQICGPSYCSSGFFLANFRRVQYSTVQYSRPYSTMQYILHCFWSFVCVGCRCKCAYFSSLEISEIELKLKNADCRSRSIRRWVLFSVIGTLT